MPTKPEQADLLMVLFGRNAESPGTRGAASTPGGCFDAALEAARIALKYRTPVYLLSDAYLANGSEPWLLPDADALPEIRSTSPRAEPGRRVPAVHPRPGDARRAWAIPARPGSSIARRPREAGRDRQRLLRPRQPRPDGAAAGAEGREHRGRHPELAVDDPDGASLLVLGWGGTYGPITLPCAVAQGGPKKVGRRT
jgi:2-oxoglutarate ferredoxin oxidoreductase subunit alpha